MICTIPGYPGTTELYAFAKRIGLRSAWVQNPLTTREHFDLTAKRFQAALSYGAAEVDTETLVEVERFKLSFSTLYSVDNSSVSAGVLVSPHGIVYRCAPILVSKCLGKPWAECLKLLRSKGYRVVCVK